MTGNEQQRSSVQLRGDTVSSAFMPAAVKMQWDGSWGGDAAGGGTELFFEAPAQMAHCCRQETATCILNMWRSPHSPLLKRLLGVLADTIQTSANGLH